jgi:hypothetical protein
MVFLLLILLAVFVAVYINCPGIVFLLELNP